jgi:hypothetical protein
VPAAGFTIVIEEAKHPSDSFTVGDLNCTHQECGGGPLKVEQNGRDWWYFTCGRCGVSNGVGVGNTGTVALIKTCLDGEPRVIEYAHADPTRAIRRPK